MRTDHTRVPRSAAKSPQPPRGRQQYVLRAGAAATRRRPLILRIPTKSRLIAAPRRRWCRVSAPSLIEEACDRVGELVEVDQEGVVAVR